MSIVIGRTYKFNNRHELKPELRDKFFKVLDRTRIQVYNNDGSIIFSGMGNPSYNYNHRTIGSSIDFSYIDIEPVKSLKKFSLS
jgi:hypothetical protein